MKTKVVILTLTLMVLPVIFFGAEYTMGIKPKGLYSEYDHESFCKVHRAGRDYSKHPIVIYKNASIWNTHTPRDYYYWVKGLPKVDCEIPCIFTWDESMAREYTDVYFWDVKPGNDCDNHSLNFYSTMESPVRFKYEVLENLRKGYDIVATMGLDSDIPLPYLSSGYFNKISKSKVLPKRQDAMMSFFISNCGAKDRLEYLNELIKYDVTYHSFGKCLHNMDVEKITGSSESKKNDVIKHYKFYFCFENSVYKDYVTEKVYHALDAGTVPIYYGAPNFADFVPKNSVIDVRKFASPKELAEYLVMLSNNEEEYNKYHAWRKDIKSSLPKKLREILTYEPKRMLCHLCIRAADINRMKYGLEKIPEDKMWDKDVVNPGETVFLVRERGQYWTKPVFPKEKTIEALKSAIIQLFRPKCEECEICNIHEKYDRNSIINTTEQLAELPNYFEMEVDLTKF